MKQETFHLAEQTSKGCSADATSLCRCYIISADEGVTSSTPASASECQQGDFLAPSEASQHKGETIPFQDGAWWEGEGGGAGHGQARKAAMWPHPKPAQEAPRPDLGHMVSLDLRLLFSGCRSEECIGRLQLPC